MEKLATPEEPPHPARVEGFDAYLRDKPELLEHRRQFPSEKWVAYHRSQRIAFGTSQRELFIECLKRGIPRVEIFVIGIDPTIERVMEAVIS